MNGNKIPIIATICALAVMVAVILSFVFLKNDPAFEDNSETSDVTLPELTLLSDEEIDKIIKIETTYGAFSIPYAFGDIINVKPVNEDGTAALQFFSKIEGKDVLIYTIHYNNDIGIPCGKLVLSEGGAEITVTVVFEDVPETLATDWVSTFQATQETFNNVITSMAEDSRFTLAD